jgi:hypothetical protein
VQEHAEQRAAEHAHEQDRSDNPIVHA